MKTTNYTDMETAGDKALKLFADLMVEKIRQVEDNWHKPWLSTQGGGLPQNIEGRAYNGVNSFMLFLLSEKMNYSLPVYMTFMQAKDNGVNVLKGEKSFPVIYWNFSIKDKEGRKITLGPIQGTEQGRAGTVQSYPFHENLQRIQRASDQPARNTPGEMGIPEREVSGTGLKG